MNKMFSYLRVNFLDRKHTKNYIINFKRTNLRSNQINTLLYYIIFSQLLLLLI